LHICIEVYNMHVVCNTDHLAIYVQVSARGGHNSSNGDIFPHNLEIKNWYQIKVEISRVVVDNNLFLIVL